MRRHSSSAIFFAAALAACGPTPVDDAEKGANQDVDDALAEMPEAEVLLRAADGLPQFIVGDLARASVDQTDDMIAADTQLRPTLSPVFRAFRLRSEAMKLRRVSVDEQGGRHFRYNQVHNGLPVIGGDLVVHVDVRGAVNGVNGTARGDIPDTLGVNGITAAAAMSAVRADNRFASSTTSAPREVYIQTQEGSLHKAYETVAEGLRGQDPYKDKVYIDVDSGAIVAVHPTLHYAKNRAVYTANGGTTLPGTIKRTEGQAANADATVNLSYDNAGTVYDAYNSLFGRDSYDNAGAQLKNTVHYSRNYCNAFWDGTQMVYGDGDASQGCGNLAESLDVTGHELSHAVTEHESGLIYSGESGGLNESLSDIFGNGIESWKLAGASGNNFSQAAAVWKVGESVLPPFLRDMCDPAADGASRDIWSSTLGNVDVHYSSGPNNLAFCLLAKTEGTHKHPRGKTNITVPVIGIEKTLRLYYKAQVDILTASSNYAAMRAALETAATQLYDQATKDAVGCAFAAIGVGSAPATCGGGTEPPPPPPGVTPLTKGTAVTGLSGATGTSRFFSLDVPAGSSNLTFTTSGGSGDLDLYVKLGSQPSTTDYLCKSEGSTNAETCTIAAPAAGKYFVLLSSFANFSGASLVGNYSTTTGDPYITSGVPKTGLSGAQNSNTFFRIAVPAGARTLTVRIQGGSGDSDLYTRFGSRPTTSTYSCRPYLNGNNETCTLTNPQQGDHYIMLRGYSSFSNVSLTGTVQ